MCASLRADAGRPRAAQRRHPSRQATAARPGAAAPRAPAGAAVVEDPRPAAPPRTSPVPPLDEPSARSALDAACAAVGLDPRDAELIRIGENGVFRLRSRPVVARVGRSSAQLPAAEQQLAVSRWLQSQEVPAIRALDVEQPVAVSGRVVTFWESAADDVRYGTTRELGTILRRLHHRRTPAEPHLPELAPFDATRRRIEHVPIGDDDRRYLRGLCENLTKAYEELPFTGPGVVLHGDANVGNLILNRHGNALLSDLDSFCVGPAEWDLVLTGMFYRRFGWHTTEEYRQFVSSYGRDVIQWPGFDVLADIRELLMVAWLAQNAHNDAAAAEFAKRLDSMRRGDSRRHWNPF
jgi:aminoglycoside phosphotransferase (APT) family kinase protein